MLLEFGSTTTINNNIQISFMDMYNYVFMPYMALYFQIHFYNT